MSRIQVNKIPLERPTKDIDFLGYHLSNNTENIRNAIKSIISIKADDGVTYDPDSIAIDTITEESKYNGYRVNFVGQLGQARKRLQLDIGFGDKIVPESYQIEFPTFLNQPAPEIKVYSIESAIAEKLEAIVRFNYLTSRLKDFYDIWYLSQQFEFKSQLLKKAILTTFNNRNMNINDIEIVFEKDFLSDKSKAKQWQAFIKRNRLNLDISFRDCMQALSTFLNPIIHLKQDNLYWKPSLYKWQNTT